MLELRRLIKSEKGTFKSERKRQRQKDNRGSSSFMDCSSEKSQLGCDYVGGEGLQGESSCEDDSVDD
ncbi:hypothetical protein Tco_1438380 [Tanacetum coccineum]